MIVIDELMALEIDAAEERLHVGERRHIDAALPHLAERQLVIRIAPHQRGQVERDAQARAAVGQQLLVARVRLFRRPEPRKLPHRPRLAVIAGGVDASRVGKLSGVAEIALIVEGLDVSGRVERGDGTPGDRRPGTASIGAAGGPDARRCALHAQF